MTIQLDHFIVSARNKVAAAVEHASIEEVQFCCFSAGDLAVYQALLRHTAP